MSKKLFSTDLDALKKTIPPDRLISKEGKVLVEIGEVLIPLDRYILLLAIGQL